MNEMTKGAEATRTETAEAPPGVGPEEAVRVRQSPNRCPFCHDDVRVEESVACRDCLARHHEGCWDEGAGCSTCRCQVRMAVASDREELSRRVVTRALAEKGYDAREVRDWIQDELDHANGEVETVSAAKQVGFIFVPIVLGILGMLFGLLLADLLRVGRADGGLLVIGFGGAAALFGLVKVVTRLARPRLKPTIRGDG